MRLRHLTPLVLLAGCSAVGPEYERPEVSLNPDWLQAELEEFDTSPAELAVWWETLEDPVLTELINTAIVQNNSIRIAGLRVLEAEAQLGIARGNRFPQVQVITGDASYTDTGDLTQEQYNLGAGLSWEIDFWGRFRRGSWRNRADPDAARDAHARTGRGHLQAARARWAADPPAARR